ncbi:MAG: nucleotidyltransferase domain-containing protein [Candidatus Bathyarchaeia archaeon]
MEDWIPKDGDAFLTREGLLFYVFGYEHPPGRVFSFLKYIPSQLSHLFPLRYLERTWKMGETELNRAKKLYTAQNLQGILETFRRHFSSYVYFCPFRGKEIMSAPLSLIEKVFDPKSCLQKIMEEGKRDPLQSLAFELVDLLSAEAGVSLDDFGVHGSLALGMHTAESDIDLAVYGAENFRLLEATVDKLVDEGLLSYVFTRKLDRFRRHRARYRGKTFVYTAVRKTEEITSNYGEHRYLPIKPVTFRCRITDDCEAMFRPAIYRVEDYQPLDPTSELQARELPSQVVSMMGCYRNAARQGATIKVSGTLERVERIETGETHYQVVVGTGTRGGEYLWPL